MTLVRDRTLKKTEYKGRETDACDSRCPCRECYNAHDCSYLNTVGKQVVRMECATRWNNGCPNPKPEPQHIYSARGKVCKRCGERMS
jgi:hypothetical protein